MPPRCVEVSDCHNYHLAPGRKLSLKASSRRARADGWTKISEAKKQNVTLLNLLEQQSHFT